MSEDRMEFQTEVSRLLDLVANALYSNTEVFLRELVSNAADACDALRYEQITNQNITGTDQFNIWIVPNQETKTLTICDNGIGMNRQDLIDNLGTIAHSGTAALANQIAQSKDQEESFSMIGQFGVGFYASFMIADKVEVISRRAGEDALWHWESDGKTGFTVRECAEEETLNTPQGTKIILHVKTASQDFLLDDRIKQIIKKYSDHISIPIHLGLDKDSEALNKASALWTRPKQDISDEEYGEFYRHVSHSIDAPSITAHWKAEGVIEYTGLIFVPTIRPFDMYEPRRTHGVKLYVKRVFISENCEGLIPPWLRFLRGIIDSEDLPLNISREMLQTNPVIRKISNAVVKKVLGELKKMAESDPATYSQIWHVFGAVIKEGLYDAIEHRESIFDICRFYSTSSETPISLESYIERMKEGQSDIYYISGEDIDALRTSPQIEGFKEKGIEVLFMNDTVDEFWLQSVKEYKDVSFKSVTRGDINLDDFDDKKTVEDGNTNIEESESELSPLISAIKQTLGTSVHDVRISHRLTSSPVCLIAEEGQIDLHMEKVLRVNQNYADVSKRILEINPKHPLINKLLSIAANDDTPEVLDEAAWLLFDQACIIEGESVADTGKFVERMSKFMEQGLA